MKDIDFHIGIDCPFCFQQTTNTLISGKNEYNHIYCSYCKMEDSTAESFDSKFEMWFSNGLLISVIIIENIGKENYYSEYSPLHKEVVLFQESDSLEDEISLKKWSLRDHLDILYKHINKLDLSEIINKPGIIFKIKQILDSPYISNSIKAQLFKVEI